MNDRENRQNNLDNSSTKKGSNYGRKWIFKKLTEYLEFKLLSFISGEPISHIRNSATHEYTGPRRVYREMGRDCGYL